jgi:hypothetical protein
LDGFTLRILDAGGAPANGTVQLPVFTYDPASVTTRTLDLGSVQFDTSALGPEWAIGTLALTDDGAGTIYLTGLSKGGGPADPYDTWAGPGNAFDEDKNGDGVDNGLAFLLGAASPDANALGLLPAPVPQPGGGLVLNFSCLPDASRGSANLYVEHSADLGVTDPWAASAAVTDSPGTPVNGVMFEVTPGTPLNSVKATISSTEAVAGKLFGRLRAEKP